MKTFKLFSMAALALVMAACSSEDNALENATPAKPGLIPFSATVAPLSGATTRTVYTPGTDGESKPIINVAWKEGDQIFIARLSPDVGTAGRVTVGKPNDDGSAPLSGDISGDDGNEIEAYYPASAYDDWGIFTDKYIAQDGTLSGIQDNLDYRKGTGKISVIGGKATLADKLQMKSQIAIWKLTLQNTSGANLNATKVTIKDGSNIIAATKDISAKSEVHMAVPFNTSPTTFSNLTIEATTANGTYTYAAPNAVNLSHSTYYQSTVTLSKPAPAATSLSELKTAINGGTDCSSYIGWEVNSAGAIAESGVSGTKIGYVAYVSTSDVDAGVSGSRILVIANADAGTSILWGSNGTSRGLTADDLNGYSNTNTLQGYGSEAHPAAYAAWNYSATIPSGGATPAHWFMPTKKQWENMRDAKGGTYNAMAAAYGISDHYWTSTEVSNNNAWRFVTNSNIQSNMKSLDYNVRSIFAY